MNMSFLFHNNIVDRRCLHLLVDRSKMSTIGYVVHKRLKRKDALEYLSFLMTFLRVECCICKPSKKRNTFVISEIEREQEREREREREIGGGKYKFSGEKTI